MLTGNGIIDAYTRGDIVIEPPILWQVRVNSYDVHLDREFYVPNGDWDDDKVIDLSKSEDVDAMWERSDGDTVIIHPGETILGQTREVVGTKYPYVAKMYARSTVARMGLSVCKCAGLGDIGYVGKWTMEITNHNLNPVRLAAGMRVAQIAFFRAEGENPGAYRGQYQGGIVLPKALEVS